MKRKYVEYFIFLMLPLLSINLFVDSVKADEKCTAKTKLTQYGALTVDSLSGKIKVPHRTFNIYVGQTVAFCIEPGKPLRTGEIVIENGCSDMPVEAKKALNYCANKGCSPEEYIVAQMYIWGGDVQTAAEAICSYRGQSRKESCILAESKSGSTAHNIYTAVSATSASGNDFICWQPKNASHQKTVTKQVSSCRYYCPEDKLNSGLDITDCVIKQKKSYDTCVTELCGTEASCSGNSIELTGRLAVCTDDYEPSHSIFSEAIGPKSTSSSDSDKGRLTYKVAGSGTYCALYCLETAEAVLPGGLANPIRLGSAITWPTSDQTNTSRFGNKFPLYFHGQKECYIKVAPDLTFGQGCETDPVKTFADYRKELEAAYKKNTTAKKTVDNANKYLTGHSNGATLSSLTKIDKTPEINYLDLTNEEIRKKAIKNYNELKKSSAPNLFLSFLNTAKANKKAAEGNVTKVWQKYCDGKGQAATASHSCTGGGVYNGTTGTCSAGTKVTTYTCPDHYSLSGTQCKCTKDTAKELDGGNTKFWEEAVKAWNAAVSVLTNKHNYYNTYITKLKKTVDLYNEIYLCATEVPKIFKEDCNGSDTCQFYEFETYATMSYTDEGEYTEGAEGDHTLVLEQPAKYTCQNCDSPVNMHAPNDLLSSTIENKSGGTWLVENGNTYFSDKIKDIQNKKFEIDTGKVIYRLEDNLYNYIDKNTQKWEMDRPEHNNYITDGLDKNGKFLYSNLPTSFKNKLNKKYDLIIREIALGHKSQFTSETLKGVLDKDYVCHYTVTPKTDDPCTCPPGTLNAGMRLTSIIEQNGMTCAEAQYEYCNRDNPGPGCEENCEIFCDSDPTIEITPCINEGKTKAECEKLFCSGNNPHYVCPSGKNKGMDITDCVMKTMTKNKNYKLEEAKKYCENRLCNLDQLIIYRTIDLKNPFPSLDADELALANWPDIGAFNLTIHGRKPGSNWNSTSLVQNRIHKVVRDTDKVADYEIYKQKPLYHFELDTTTIKQIRSYNKEQAKKGYGYNDYNLTCNKTMGDSNLGAGCISSFVHNPTYGGDTNGSKSRCGGISNPNRLVECLAGGGS